MKTISAPRKVAVRSSRASSNEPFRTVDPDCEWCSSFEGSRVRSMRAEGETPFSTRLLISLEPYCPLAPVIRIVGCCMLGETLDEVFLVGVSDVSTNVSADTSFERFVLLCDGDETARVEN